ncbi:MAG: class I SAM-dependent methyltransferase [Leptospiraceae bacterium]|nr:class I SAM-dependent methyltransferase [Leptospiraceae bacterium]
MNTTCYLCGSKKNKTVFKEHEIPILKCSDCDHVFSSYEQEEHYDGYWGEEGAESFDLEWWDLAHRDIYDEFIKTHLKQDSGTLLDVGCGLGFFVKTVQEKKRGWNAIGYEMSPNAVKFAKEKNGLSTVHSGMVQNSGIAKESIDFITLWDVIEHIPKPQPLLEYLHNILKPGGVLFMQTPNFPIQLLKANLKVMLKGMKEGVHYLEAKDHINDYTRKSMTKLAIDTGFQNPEFYVMKPILSVAGVGGGLGSFAKLGYYHLTKAIWILSGKTIFLNNTLFATLRKKN